MLATNKYLLMSFTLREFWVVECLVSNERKYIKGQSNPAVPAAMKQYLEMEFASI